MIKNEKFLDHKFSGTIVWLGKVLVHVSEQNGAEYVTRKIKVEKKPGCKYANSAYFDLRGDMAERDWQVGDTVEVSFGLGAYETKYGKTGTYVVCRDIKKID